MRPARPRTGMLRKLVSLEGDDLGRVVVGGLMFTFYRGS